MPLSKTANNNFKKKSVKIKKAKTIYNNFLTELAEINNKQFKKIQASLQKLDKKKEEQIKKSLNS